MLNYESARGELPKGDVRGFQLSSSGTSISGINSLGTWVTLSLPYFEESGIRDCFARLSVNDAYSNQVEYWKHDGVHKISIDSLLCPSDEEVEIIAFNDGQYGARGNYAANVGLGHVWMNDPFWEQNSGNHAGHPLAPKTGNFAGQEERSSLWGFGPFLVNKGIKLQEATDGLSNTAAMAEILKVPGDNTRGALHWGAGVLYMSDWGPNSNRNDNTYLLFDIELPKRRRRRR